MIETKTRKPLAYNVILKRIREQQQELYQVSKWLNDNQKPVNDMFKRFDKAPEGMFAYPVSMSANGYTNNVTCSFNVTCRDLVGFKDERLMALLELFIDADGTNTTDYAADLNRDYRFEFHVGDAQHRLIVMICAYVKEESPTCRRILKEVKMVQTEQKIYDMVCDDEVIAAAPIITVVEPVQSVETDDSVPF